MTRCAVVMTLQGERLDSPMGVGRRLFPVLVGECCGGFEKNIELCYCTTELNTQTN